jgi:hypothetical protein
MEISINCLSKNSYKIIAGTQTFFFTKFEYAIENDLVSIFTPAFNFKAASNEIAVNEVREFADVTAIANALTGIGGGASPFTSPALPARGLVTLTAQPADTDTVTIDDGIVDDAVVFEFSGIKSAGSVTFSQNPSDTDTITVPITDEDDVIFEFDSGFKANATIAFFEGEAASNPFDGAKITFKGGEVDKTFIFLDDPDDETGLNEVEIGLNAAATMAAFIVKFNAVVTGWTAITEEVPDHTCTILANAVGTASNILLTTTSNYIDIDIASGVNPGGNVEPGNIGVAIGATAAATMVNFIARFNANILLHTATPNTPANGACVITALEIGTAGDITITKEGDNIVVVSPTGGADAGDNATPGNIPVSIGRTKEITAENLAEAINIEKEDSNFNIHANCKAAVVSLTNLSAGVTGNEAITKDSDAVTVSGMSGGAAAVDISTLVTLLTPAE